jgi:hypothetical protein
LNEYKAALSDSAAHIRMQPASFRTSRKLAKVMFSNRLLLFAAEPTQGSSDSRGPTTPKTLEIRAARALYVG